MRETVQFEIPKKTLKYRRDNFVLYDVEYLLDHLAQEVALLENYRQHKDKHAKLKWELLLNQIRELSAEDFKDIRTVKEVNTDEVQSRNRSPE